jgi:hypothetical protein
MLCVVVRYQYTEKILFFPFDEVVADSINLDNFLIIMAQLSSRLVRQGANHEKQKLVKILLRISTFADIAFLKDLIETAIIPDIRS